jgi:hypothetical protein
MSFASAGDQTPVVHSAVRHYLTELPWFLIIARINIIIIIIVVVVVTITFIMTFITNTTIVIITITII